jgi:hypothetical protein
MCINDQRLEELLSNRNYWKKNVSNACITLAFCCYIRQQYEKQLHQDAVVTMDHRHVTSHVFEEQSGDNLPPCNFHEYKSN